jgi:predicted PurR-regulated permease PerM
MGYFRPIVLLGTAALIIVGLSRLQAVLIPIALAGLATILLTPLTDLIERRRLGRVPAAAAAVLMALGALGGTGWIVFREVTTLADELPRYRWNIRQRILDLRGVGRGSTLGKVQHTVEEVVGDIQRPDKAADATSKPLPVVDASSPSLFRHLPTVMDAVTSTGVVTILVFFMLLERHQLRERVIQLVGYRRVTTTTRAIAEIGARISRYLLMQSLVNGSFGVAATIGLLVLGVPYAVLWGFLAMALRFIPYVGVWIALALPVILSLAVFSDWLKPALVMSLFIGLEILVSVVIEPWLYSQSAGVSQVALLVAITFWTWLWGPVGLLLATPLTVCLIVLSKHVPSLNFIATLMGDESTIEPKIRYYQQLLTGHPDEAAAIAASHVSAHGRESAYDDVLLPALGNARLDARDGHLSGLEVQSIAEATRRILEKLQRSAEERADEHESTPPEGEPGIPIHVVAWPVQDDLDSVALEMLRESLDPASYRFEILGSSLPLQEVLACIDEAPDAVLCVGTVAPGGLARIRHLCARLRAHHSDVKIIIGRWGATMDQHDIEGRRLRAAGADHVATTLVATRHSLGYVGATPGARLSEPINQLRLPVGR